MRSTSVPTTTTTPFRTGDLVVPQFVQNRILSFPIANKIRILLLLVASFLLIWLVGIPSSAWIFAMHSNFTQSNEVKIRQLIREEIDGYLSSQRCVTPSQNLHDYVSKSDHEADFRRIVERYRPSFLSWFDGGQKMKILIEEALRKHEADNVALADFALESVGGSVLSEYSSKTFTDRSLTLHVLGLPILKRTVAPNVILRSGSMPGDCWPMVGSRGHIVISLGFPVRPTMFTLEHLPKSLAFNGQLRSAPREFSVRGLNTLDVEGQFLGRFVYDTSIAAKSHIQTFEAFSRADSSFYRLIKLTIESNWGHPEFTCIYRFRVHGQAELPSNY